MNIRILNPDNGSWKKSIIRLDERENFIDVPVLIRNGQGNCHSLFAVYALGDDEIYKRSILTMEDLTSFVYSGTFTEMDNKGFIELKSDYYNIDKKTLLGAEGSEFIRRLQFAQPLDEDKIYIALHKVRKELPATSTDVYSAFNDGINNVTFFVFLVEKERKHKVLSFKHSREAYKLTAADPFSGELCIGTNYRIKENSVLLLKDSGDNGNPVYSMLTNADSCLDNQVLAPVANLFRSNGREYPYRYTWRVTLNGEISGIETMELKEYGISKIKFDVT